MVFAVRTPDVRLGLINSGVSTTTGLRVDSPAPVTATPIRFRSDIEGLRAIAVTLVVLSHAGIGAVSGGYVGVDVFFVISGFLITTMLAAHGRISLPAFYARRAVRLLPAATLVLLSTLVASWFWLPSTRFRGISMDALVSTFYGINWRLAAEGTDYLNATAAPSPLQHLWSLAVEEQFYLVWPVLLLILAGRRRATTIVLAVIVVLSLGVSVWQTSSAAPWAYFGAHTRAFELAIGALIAVVPRRTPKALTWVGLAAVLAAAVIFDEKTAFPGFAALLPVLGTAAVIAGGPVGGASRLLGLRPLQEIGRLSYGWYLWHWPVLMIGPAALGRPPTVKLNLALSLFALGLAVLSYHLLENPVRNQRWFKPRARRGLALGLALSASSFVIALVVGQFTPPLPTGPAAVSAAASLSGTGDPQTRLTQLITTSLAADRIPANLTPRLTDAHGDVPAIYGDLCHLNYDGTRQDRPCVYGDPNGTKTMYLIGDSHAAHWFPGLEAAAKTRGWKLVAMTKSACQVPSVLVWNVPLKRPYTDCVQWRDQVLARAKADRPAMIVLASNDLDNGGLIDPAGDRIPTAGTADDALWVQGWQKSFATLAQPGTQLVLLQDSPWPQGDAPECIASHARNLSACDRPLAKAIVQPARRAMVAAAARAAGVKVVDPTPWFCTTACPPIVGDTLVYKDNSHLTTAYARTLGPLLDAAL